MAYTQEPGRGPMQKTGRGIPEGFKQIETPDPKNKDEKTGANQHPGYTKPVYKAPFEGDNLSSGQSFANYDAEKDFEEKSKLSEKREKTVKFPKRGDTFNIGGRGKKNNVSIESIDPKTGSISYQNIKTGERGSGSRSEFKESIATGYSLDKIRQAQKRRLSTK